VSYDRNTLLKRIRLTGYYGMSNFGDDLFGLAAQKAGLKYWQDVSVEVIAPKIEGAGEGYTVPLAVPDYVYQMHNLLGAMVRSIYVVGGSLKADKMIFTGGSLFSSRSSGVMNVLNKVHRRSFFLSAIGVSVGPFVSISDEKKTIGVIKNFEYISVRDTRSFDFLNSLNLDLKVVHAGDLAGLMLPVARRGGKVKKIGFSPCFRADKPEASGRLCREFIQAVVEQSQLAELEVVVLGLNEHPVVGDMALCLNVFKALKKLGISCAFEGYKKAGVMKTWELISSFDAFITGRLHGAVSAYICKVPFFLDEYHIKCSDFLNDINQAQSLRLPCDDYSTGDVSKVLSVLLEETQFIRPKLSVEAYQEKSALNFTMAPWAKKNDR
jgi:polysaccharide pyruvyl transferase WcaK-like protein